MKNVSHKAPFAKKSFGQNFLVDNHYIDRILDALRLKDGETVFEIGPGRGALTEQLIHRANAVFAIELDRDMVSVLRARFGRHANFHLIESDALQVDFAETAASVKDCKIPMKLVANLPYYISTAILQRLIEQRSAFSEMVLMFQREVAERISAPSGNSQRGFLTVLVEAFLTVESLFDVPPTAFRPVPKVWSRVVRLVPKPEAHVCYDGLRTVAGAAFSQKRKMILNNLKAIFPNALASLESAGIDPKLRAEALSAEEWVRLANAVHKSAVSL